MKPTTLIAVLAAGAALLACTPKPDDQASTAAPPAAEPSAATNMPGMAMPAETKMAKGTGTVTAVDATAGTITLDHGPIPEAGWPAMTMAFKATPDQIAQVKTGETVDFDLKLHDGGGELAAIRKSGK